MIHCHHCQARVTTVVMEHPDGSSVRLRWKSFLKMDANYIHLEIQTKMLPFYANLKQVICECTSSVHYRFWKKGLPTKFLATSGMYGMHLLQRDETRKNCNSFKHTTYLLSSQSNPKGNIVLKSSTTKWRVLLVICTVFTLGYSHYLDRKVVDMSQGRQRWILFYKIENLFLIKCSVTLNFHLLN